MSAGVTMLIVILIVERIYRRHMFTLYLLPTHCIDFITIIFLLHVGKRYKINIDSKITLLNQVVLSYTSCPNERNDYRPN